jgi:hypothetical protein
MVRREFLAPREIFLNFIERNGYTIQAMAADHRTSLGPFIPVQSQETLRRLLAYLGATTAQLADFDSAVRRWGQGTVRFTLQPCRKPAADSRVTPRVPVSCVASLDQCFRSLIEMLASRPKNDQSLQITNADGHHSLVTLAGVTLQPQRNRHKGLERTE